MNILQRIRWGRVSLAGAAVLGTGLWFSSGDETVATLDGKPGQTLLVNRPWIDHLPQDERDMVTQAIFLDKGGQREGAMLRASRWRAVAEGFRWAPREGGLVVEFPQVGRKIPVNAEARECKDAPKPFDLCLDISLLGKGMRLYSKKEWQARDVHTPLWDTIGAEAGMALPSTDTLPADADVAAWPEPLEAILSVESDLNP